MAKKQRVKQSVAASAHPTHTKKHYEKKVGHEDYSIATLLLDMRNRSFLSAHAAALRVSQAIISYAHVESKKTNDPEVLIHKIEQTRNEIIQVDPRMSIIRNTLFYLLPLEIRTEKTTAGILDVMRKQHTQVQLHCQDAKNAFRTLGEQKIRKASNILVFGFNPDMLDACIDAKKHKEFTVFVPQAGPDCVGKKSASYLARANIPVVYVSDNHLRYAIKHVDLVLVDAESIDDDLHSYGPMGSEMACELAETHNKPVYLFLDSWQFDPMRRIVHENTDGDLQYIKSDGIWPHHPQGVTVLALAYERIKGAKCTGIISDLGVITPWQFVEEVREKYKTIF